MTLLVLGCIGLISPRLLIIVLAIFTDYLSRAYDGLLWPILGFLFMPLTMLAYALAQNQNGEVSGIYLAIVVVAVILDLGLLSGSGRQASKRRR